ncbi:formylmethanofuran dehydrogenase subunit A [Aureimonas fodinaquatilis]|uniref:Formylmethanofuran dehydrogenase subunit A n=1 Tax=Aureimonas fodinaquatilis TaxID=2565783 RepID=A0A5B0DRJ4_9HYPH|nr:formylmethanofuran dehydrogenase subunit A [Aureimonas fodinaquatilis]KAA0968622.1 formylmethanofuran dehydrogenase subunit A [Aureimonas fodinaquatilis]
MRLLLTGGRVIDPANGRDEIADLMVEDGRIVASLTGTPDTVVDCTGQIVMAGAIDIHAHIAGGHVNTARLLLPEFHPAHQPRPPLTPLAQIGWTTGETGLRYAQMGFTLVVEPATGPSSALHAHLELADIPIIDRACLVVLGNDEFLLSLLRDKASNNEIDDYVAWQVSAAQALGVKCINAGGSAAFKANVRAFSFDDEVPGYGLTSRQIVKALQGSVERLGIAHPLHVHCNNLGVPGAGQDAVMATMAAAEGSPMHLAHIQFYGYGTEGSRGFSSAAARIAEKVNTTPEITVDIGQVMFGPTVTISSDELRQFAGSALARPHKSILLDGDANGGGVVPMNYRKASYYNALQWAIGLELFLLINDPWRVFFTTDHPNGAPFTAYPDLFALLMSRDLRQEWLAGLPDAVQKRTALGELGREYSLTEIATMTRAAPARLLGVADRGHLAAGALADIAVYQPQADIAALFARAACVVKNGEVVVRDGAVVHRRRGRTLALSPPRDPAMVKRLEAFHEQKFGLPLAWFEVTKSALGDDVLEAAS